MKFSNLNYKKTTLSVFFVSLLVFSFLTQVSFAADAPSGKDLALTGASASAGHGGLDTTSTDLPAMLGSVISYLFGIVGVIFLAVIIYGGVMWMVAGGSEEKVSKAKNLLRNGILGIIIIFLSYSIIYTVLRALASASATPS